MLLLSLLIAAAQAAPGTASPPQSPAEESWEKLKIRIESAPQEVANFIQRRAGCNHFAGEAGSGDPGRERQVQQALGELRCDEIEADERSLQRAYRKQAKVIELLEATRDILAW